MVVAACACMATAAYGATVYQVTENGIVNGIDLTTGDYDPLSLAGPSSGDLYMTGTVVHAAASVATPFNLVGMGGGLNMFSSGLLTSPLKFTGTAGYFDFQNENITLGDDWRDKLQLPSSSSFYVSFKTFDIAGGTDANWLVFDPPCPLRFDGTSSIGYKGGNSRVKVYNRHTQGCYWGGGRGHSRTNGKIYAGGVDTAGGVPGYVHFELTGGTLECCCIEFSRNVTSANSTQASLGLTNMITLTSGDFKYGHGFSRHGPDWVHFKFAGSGRFWQNGYYGEICKKSNDNSNEGGFIFESVNGATISVSPHASSCGTDSRIETRGTGNFYIAGNGTDANENILGNKIVWNHKGKVLLGGDNSGSLRISGANALPYGEGKGDVQVNCKYLCLDNSQTVNSIYGNGQTYARLTGVTVTVGAHGGDCRYKMPIKMAVGATLSYNNNGSMSTRTNYGWDVAKIGAGTMTLESSVQKTLAVNEGSVRVTAAPVEVPTLTMAAGTSLSVASGATLHLGAFDNVNGGAVSVEWNGTLLFVAETGVTREVDLAGYSLANGATVGGVGGGKVVFANVPADVRLLAKEGELEIATLADGSQRDMASVTVAAGATLTLDAGINIRTSSLDVRGTVGEESTTYGGNGTSLDGLAGDGTVEVVARTVTWTGAGGDAKISTAANWQGGEVPLLGAGTQNAVFPADAARMDVIVDVDASFAGVSLGGVSYSFTGADTVFGVGTNGLTIAEPASGTSPVYDFSVKMAQSGYGAWQMPTASPESKIYFRRPLVDGAAPGRIYASGKTFYFHSTNSTYTGGVYLTNDLLNAVYAYGTAPFGTNGTLCIRGYNNNNNVLTLTDTKIGNNVELDINSTGRRRTIAFAGATNEFFGTFCVSTGNQADNNVYKTVVNFHQGYGTASHNNGYVNWGDNRQIGEIHMLGRLQSATLQQTGNVVHFYCASNVFGHINGYHGTYSPVTAPTVFHFHVDDAFYRAGYQVATYGTWNFNGTEQRVGSLLCDDSTLYLDSFGAPGKLHCTQTHYYSDLAKSRYGLRDFMFRGVFRGEMSFVLEAASTRKLVMCGVSTATGTVEVAGGTLCFTNGASWVSATNVVVSGSGVLEAYNANAFGDGTADMHFSGSAKWDGHGTVQKVYDLYFNGVRQPQGYYCAQDYPNPPPGTRKTDFIVGTGRIHAYGDGYGTMIIFR